MSKSQVSTFQNGKPVFQRTCKYCGAQEIILAYERISDDWQGNQRHRYVARTLSGDIHNCVVPIVQSTIDTFCEHNGGTKKEEA